MNLSSELSFFTDVWDEGLNSFKSLILYDNEINLILVKRDGNYLGMSCILQLSHVNLADKFDLFSRFFWNRALTLQTIEHANHLIPFQSFVFFDLADL